MTQLLENAVTGTALILATALLRRVLKKRLAPGVWLALWAVCLFRLLTPIAPTSVLSLWGLFGRFVPADRTAAPVPAAPYDPTSGLSPAALPQTAAPGTVPQVFPWERVLPAVWLVVGAVLAARYALAYLRTRRAVESTVPVGRNDPRYEALPRCARLREGPMEGAPLTFGVVRPAVVLTPGLTGAELDCVLAHEAVHARRRDNLWHYGMAAALAIYWWNPAVWLMARLLRRDIELSCDRAALARLGRDRRADYARALVSLSTREPGPDFCQTFGRKMAEERILAVMKFKKMSICSMILALALVCGVTVALASGPKAGETEETTVPVTDDCPENTPTVGASIRDYAIDPDPCAPGMVSVRMEGNVVKQVVIPLDYLPEDLAVQVDCGRMTRAEADAVLAGAQAVAVDGVLDWTCPEGCALRHEELGDGVSANGYWDENGEFVQVSFSEIVSLFLLPDLG